MKPRGVVIIGGGLAGGAAATRLAQQGVDVLLLEKEVRPCHKVCGEFISFEAQHYLKGLGIDPLGCGAHSIDRLRLVRRCKIVEASLGFKALSLSRQHLDRAVLAGARSHGAEIRRNVNVTGLTRDKANWIVHCHDQSPVLAKAVFHGTGKHDLRGWSHRTGQQNDYISFKMYFRLDQAQQKQLEHHVEIIFFEGGYAGVEPIEENMANLCLVITKEQFAAWGKTWDALLAKLMEGVPQLAEHLKGATPCWDKPLSIFGIPYGFVYRPSADEPEALFRLGDQMAVIPSLWGDGMAIALHTGLLAADCYMETNSLDYHRRARQQLKGQIRYATVVAQFLSFSPLQSLALTLCELFPGLISNSIKHTRIKN